MDKISIQITINAITSPELLQYLTSIESPKHRAERLRRLAEIGLGVVVAMPPGTPAGSQPIAPAAPVVPLMRSTADNRTAPRADPAYESLPTPPQVPPAPRRNPPAGDSGPPVDASIAALPRVVTESSADAAPPPFVVDLNSAMDRFF